MTPNYSPKERDKNSSIDLDRICECQAVGRLYSRRFGDL
jgi:hypothetical protein